VFTARYALSLYIKEIRFVFKGIISIKEIHSDTRGGLVSVNIFLCVLKRSVSDLLTLQHVKCVYIKHSDFLSFIP
jgi:hypothetical protein